jgi:hypothetical protein
MAPRRQPQDRAKYGSEHQRIKRALLANMSPETPCARQCGIPLAQPGPHAKGRADPPELDHLDGGGRGLSHKFCNRVAGAKAGLLAAAASAQREEAPRFAGNCIHDRAWPWPMAGPGEPACECGALLGGRIWPDPARGSPADPSGPLSTSPV